MLRKQIDILSVGDMTTDAFIRLKDPHIHCRLDQEGRELCLPFDAKVPFEYVKVIHAVGNAANAAVCAARLGLRSALLADAGDDDNGRECLRRLHEDDVVSSFIKLHNNKPTNYHFVLWYGNDRTILVNHVDYDRELPSAMRKNSSSYGGTLAGLPPKWIYLTSLPKSASSFESGIAGYLGSHPEVKLAFQPGTFQLSLGLDGLKRFCGRAHVFICNLQEAEALLRVKAGAVGIKTLLKRIADEGPELVVVTDGTKGAYMFDGDHFYWMPMYPDPREAFERTGCGDAFSATFVSALSMGRTPLEALIWAPVNSMSVAQFVGSQEGLLSLDQLDWWLERAPVDYRPKEL